MKHMQLIMAMLGTRKAGQSTDRKRWMGREDSTTKVKLELSNKDKRLKFLGTVFRSEAERWN